jgi:SAM-dependent methyltransferase
VRVVGADRSPEMLAVLASKPGGARAAVVRCDAMRMAFRRAFDAVVFSHFLHLVPSLDGLAAELKHALVPGAHLVVVDTSTGRSPAEMRVLEIVMPLLAEEWKPAPAGDDSRSRRHLRELLGHLGGEEIEVGPILTFPSATTLRDVLTHVRERTWSKCRAHPSDAVARAADEAERLLLAEGADLDAPVDAPVEVRLIVGRIPSG